MRNKARQKRSKTSVQLTIRFEGDTYNYIVAESDRNEISISAQVNLLVKEAIRNRQQKG